MIQETNLMLIESLGKLPYFKKIMSNEWYIEAVRTTNDKVDFSTKPIMVNEKQVFYSIPKMDSEDYSVPQRNNSIVMDSYPLFVSENHLAYLRDLIKEKNFKRIVLATDPDADGEAIAEFLRQELNLGDNYERIILLCIRKEEIFKQLKNTTKINLDLISQKYPLKSP